MRLIQLFTLCLYIESLMTNSRTVDSDIIQMLRERTGGNKKACDYTDYNCDYASGKKPTPPFSE